MSGANELAEEIVLYLSRLNVKQQKAVLAVVKSYALEPSAKNDKSFLVEMENRLAELESGKVKALTLEELESGVKQSFKNRRRKRQ